MFLVAEEENSRCSRFIPPLLFMNMDWKHTAYHIINSDPGHTQNSNWTKIWKQRLPVCQKALKRRRKKRKKEKQLQSDLRYTQTQ